MSSEMRKYCASGTGIQSGAGLRAMLLPSARNSPSATMLGAGMSLTFSNGE